MTATQPMGSRAPTGGRRIGVMLLIVAGVACVLLAMLAGSGVAGYYVGLDDRARLAAQEADKFFQQGLADLASGKLTLAEADFAYVLSIDPDYAGAAQKLEEVRQRIVAAQRIDPTPTTSLQDALADVYAAARQAYDEEEWATAISRLTQIRRLDPTYESKAVEELLFNASYTYGLQLLNGGRLEEGVFYLDQAAALRPIDRNAAQQSELAKQYLTAIGYWNADWDLAIQRFGELYTIAPGYKDVFDRYVNAHILYADSFVSRGDFCPAQPLYQTAAGLRPDPSVQARLDDATAQCLIATPTPLTGTLPISGTPVVVPGISAGRLAYPVFDEATGAYLVFAISAGGSPFQAAAGGQPAWQPNGSSLAYRVLGVGINVVDLSSSTTTLVAPAGSAWPTWSPDGSRIAYAQRDAAGNFQLFIAQIDGAAPPIELGPGRSPVWGPNGILAYSGCDARGCGIMIDNPGDADPPARLTASANDTPTSWSPDGYNISYYSDAGGNWDVFFVNRDGVVQQVTNTPSVDGIPAWSPDGAHLAFVSDRDGRWAIYVIRFDGAELVKAIDLGAQNPNWASERLAWSP